MHEEDSIVDLDVSVDGTIEGLTFDISRWKVLRSCHLRTTRIDLHIEKMYLTALQTPCLLGRVSSI
jgi:hypothetical protein